MTNNEKPLSFMRRIFMVSSAKVGLQEKKRLGFRIFALGLILQGLFGESECRQVLWIHLDGLQALTGGNPIALHGDTKIKCLASFT